MTKYVYAETVRDGDRLEGEDWPGRLGNYEVDFYLLGPLNVQTTESLRYGYTLHCGRASTERGGFASLDVARDHAQLVKRMHDSQVTHMAGGGNA